MVRPHRLLLFHVAARAALLSQGSTTAALGWWSPNSLTARLLVDGGAIGEAMLIAMSGLVCLGWLDVLVNDIMPERMKLTPLRANEHLGYMMLGGVFWVQAMGSTSTELPGAGVLLANYLMVGGVCCWYGWTSAMLGGRKQGNPNE